MLARRIRYRWSMVLSRLRVRYYRLMGIMIGDNCYISSGAHIDVNIRSCKIIIGNKVHLAYGSFILGHAGGLPLKESQTKLEDNVRVLVNAIILPGVKIGENSIIGAGALVGREVPPNVVMLGNPARVVKYLDGKKTVESITDIESLGCAARIVIPSEDS